MPAGIFTEILARGVREGQIPNRTKTAREWFRRQGRRVRNQSASDIIRESRDRWRNQVHPGHCYLFNYDPKWKRELPYYDSFPIIFPFGKSKGRFIGFNLHYLPAPQRAVMMDALYNTATDRRYDEKTKLQLNYQQLKAMAKFKYFKPTIHEYLTPHVVSRIVKIDPADWDTALFMPLQEFRKASADQVWRDSRAAIGLKRSRRPTK